MSEVKAVAKSLHTISAIVNVARHFLQTDAQGEESAIRRAMQVLTLANRPDPYGLEAVALKQLRALKPQILKLAS